MERRQFLATSLAAAATAIAYDATAQASASRSREFYQLRRYHLQTGPQTNLTESYFGDALIPALTRMGMGPIGAFRLDIGSETPTFYLLIPGSSIEALAEVDLHLAQDDTFLTAAESFWNAPATAPAFLRVDSSLLAAFEGWAAPDAAIDLGRQTANASFSYARMRVRVTAIMFAKWKCFTMASSRYSKTPASILCSSAIR